MKFKYLILYLLLFSNCSNQVKKSEPLQVSSGKVERLENFQSKYIPSRNIDVWLPEDYSTQNKYAVLYMHDGQMLFDATKSWNKQEWGVDEAMSELLKDGKIRKTIVVGIWNTEFRHSEYFPQQPFESLPQNFQDSLLSFGSRNQNASLFKTKVCSDNYLKFIVEELKPNIDNTYSTLPDVKNTFVAGSSMGGLISMYALCEYPEIFSGAGCLSTHWVGTFDTLNNPIPQKFIEYLDANLPNSQTHKIYFDYGTETLDALYEPFQLLVDSVMTQHDYNSEHWKTLKFEGENHSENAWKKRLNIPMEFLLKK